MNRRKPRVRAATANKPTTLFWLALATLALGLAISSTGAAEDYPQGCVDCHVEGSGALDMRINAVLSRLGHGKAADRSKQIPQACDRCHAASGDGPATALRNLIHRAHYTQPEDNLFTKQYGGDCQHCHSMDAANGRVAVKSGERNWTPIVGGEPVSN